MFILVLLAAPSFVYANGICITPHSVQQTSNTSTSITINWEDFSTPADIIEYQISHTLLGESPNLNTYETSTEKTITLQNLEVASTYQVRLRTVCVNGNTTWSAPVYVYTEIDPSQSCDLNLQIDDNSCGNPMNFRYPVTGIGDSLGVNAFIREIRIAISHAWPADLECKLISPSGSEVILFQDQGIGSTHVGNISDACSSPLQIDMSACESVESTANGLKGILRPQGDLSDFYTDFQNPNGDWFIKICDDANGQVGVLRTFEIIFEEDLCAAPESIGITDITDQSIDLVIPASNCDSLEILVTSASGVDSIVLVVPCETDIINVSGLQSSTDYSFQFSASCAENNLSASCITYFETYCDEASLIEDFDSFNECTINCTPCTTGSLFSNVGTNQWKVGSGNTNTDLTGPRESLFSFGNYLYLESSEDCSAEDLLLQSSCLELVSNSACNVSFYYHMEGAEISSLYLEISYDNGQTWDTYWQKNGAQGSVWIAENLELNLEPSQLFQIRFRASVPQGDLGDIAIDQIRFSGVQTVSESSQVFYKDEDEDGYGSLVDSIIYCSTEEPLGFSSISGDCDDLNPMINPSIPESECNGIDDNCNNQIDEDSNSSLSWNLIELKDQSCNGVIDGLITVEATGGIGPYEIIWNTGQETFSIDNLESGEYFATISDAGNCTIQTDTFTVELLQSFDFLVSSTAAATCLGKNDGYIEVFHDEDNAPYTYLWSNGSTEKDLYDIGPGAYELIIEDVNGCTISSGDIIVEAEIEVALSFDSIEAVTCANQMDGFASINMDSSYTNILWETGESELSIDNLSGGFYSITVTDSTGCQDIDSIFINEPDPLSVEIVSNESVSCFGENDGFLEVTTVGGNPGKEYEWNEGTIGNTLDLLTAGFYSVTVSDSKNCVDSILNIEISEPDSLIATIIDKEDELCFSENGSISLGIEGGTQDYEFLWSNDSTIQNLSNLSTGSYSVTVVDRNNCQAFVDNIEILRNNQEVQTELVNATDISCFGKENGTIELSFQGVTKFPIELNLGGVIYEVTDSTELFESLSSGTYNIGGTDSNGCTLTPVFTNIEEPKELEISIIGINTVSCGDQGGEIEIEVNGGTEPYDILWSTGESVEFIDSLQEGLYSIEVIDSNMCADSIIDIEIVSSTPLVQEKLIVDQPLCNGDNTGLVDIEYTGGLGDIVYVWNGEPFDLGLFEGLPAGNYDLIVRDSASCNIDSLNFEIINPPIIEVSIDSVAPSYCGMMNGFISINAVGGTGILSYNWSGNIVSESSIATNVDVGIYDLVVIDENNCGMGIEDIEIVNIDKTLNIENLFIDSTSCHDSENGKIFYDLQGDYAFPITTHLNDSLVFYENGFINNLGSGTYDLVITDAVGCTYELGDINIESPLPITYEIEILTPIICHDDSTGAIFIEGMGGTGMLDYLWNNNDDGELIDSLGTGYYRCAIVDERNCVLFTDSIYLENPDTLIVDIQILDAMNGENNGAIYVNTSGGVLPYTYNWSYDLPDDVDTIEFLGPSMWDLNFVDGNGCMFDTSFVIQNIVNISEIEEKEINVYPNPFVNRFKVRTEIGGEDIIEIEIVDGLGKIVMRKEHLRGEQIEINMEGYQSGLYYVIVRTESGIKITKVIKI